MATKLPQDDEQAAVELWYALLRTTATLRGRMRSVFARWGLSGAQWGVLRVIGEAGPDGVMLSHISDRLVVTHGNTTGLVDRLEQAGYVRRFRHPEDRRAKLVTLTDEGLALYADVRPVFRREVLCGLDCLTPARRRALGDILADLAARALADREAGSDGEADLV